MSDRSIESGIATILNSAPVYTEAEIKVDGIDRVFTLIVRDRPTFSPDDSRRCTCTTSGTEWFISEESLQRFGGIDSFAVTKWPSGEWRII